MPTNLALFMSQPSSFRVRASIQPIERRLTPPRLSLRPHVFLAAIAAALLPSFGYAQAPQTGGLLRIWAGAGNANFQNGPNWQATTTNPVVTGPPDFSDGETTSTGAYASAGTDSILFPALSTLGGVGQLNLVINLNAANAGNTGTVNYTLRGITFDAGAGGYTFQTNTNPATAFILGDSTDPVANPQNTGNIINNSTATQTFNLGVNFRFGKIDAAEGQIVFTKAVNIGNNLIGANNNVTIDGSSLVPGQSTVTFSGSLTGLGTDTSLGGALIKNGTGSLVLSGDNSTWNGRIEINDGTVVVNSAASLGSNAGRTTLAGGFSSGAVLLNNSGTNPISIGENFYAGGRSTSALPQFVNAAGNFTLAGAIHLQSGGSEFGFRSDAGTLTIAGPIDYDTASAATTFRLSGASNGVISSNLGSGGLGISVVKEGTGTWTLSGTNAYTGSTQINGGRLNISTSQTGSGSLSVKDTATLGLSLAATGQTLNTSSLTLGTNTGATLDIDLGAFGGSGTPVITTGSFDTHGTNLIIVKGTGLSVGTIPLISYTGNILGNGFGGLALSGLPPRVTANLSNAASVVSLNITAFDFPKWTGLVGSTPSGTWNINNGSDPTTGSGAANWKEANSGAVTRYLQTPGSAVDSVLFDDSATGTTDVTLSTTLTPVTATVNNSALTYTFQGLGKLSGGTNLVKQGSGKLIIANTGGNDYTGTTTISGGIVQIGDGSTFGGGQFGAGPVINNASIVLLRPDAENFNFNANISGTGSITKQGLNTATISGVSTFTGPVVVSSGILRIGSTSALGSTAGGTTVQPGATLDVGDLFLPAGEVVTISGDGAGLTPLGALINSGPAGVASTGLHDLALAGNASIGGSKRFDVRDGTLAGGGFTLTKIGSNTIFLANLGETHLGNIVLNQGRISVEGSTTFGDQPGVVQVTSTGELGFENSTVPQTKTVQIDGGKVVFNTGTANEIAGNFTLGTTATNTIQGPLSATAVAALTVSGPISGSGSLTKTQLGTLTLSGANTYTGGTTISGGAVHFVNPAAVPATGTIAVGDTGSVGFGFAFDQAFLTSRVAPTVNSITISLGVDNANNFDFTNYSGASLGAYTAATYSGTLKPYSTASGGSYRLGGDGGTLTYIGSLTGNNTLDIGNSGSAGNVVLTGANSYTGRTTIAAGSALQLANAAALGAASNPLTVNGTLDLNGFDTTVGSLTAANTGLITDNSTAPGITVITDDVASGSSNFTGSINNGANGRILALVKAGAGTLVLNKANGNNFTGGTTVRGGRLELRVNNAQILANGSNLSFGGTGTFAAANNGSNSLTLTLGNLAFNAGEGTFETNNQSGTATGHTTVFSTAPTRAPGATGNFTLVGTTFAQTYKVVFTNAPTVGSAINGGLFFGGNDFAAYDSVGYLRALDYTKDTNTFDTGLTESQGNFGPNVGGRDVQVSGSAYAILNQGTESIHTLKIAGANNITLGTGATLTITGGGLIKAGGNSSTISGGNGLTVFGSTDFVIRTASAADVLTITTPIVSTSTGGLTKAGAGSLILGGLNTFTGGVWVNAGTLQFTSQDAIPATGDIRLNTATTVSFGHAFDQAFLASRVPATTNAATIALGADNTNNLDFSAAGLNYSAISLGATGTFNYNGTLTPFNNIYRLGGGGGTLTPTQPLTGANSLIVGSGGSGGTVVLPTANTYTGGTTLITGTLRLGHASALGAPGGAITLTGGTLDLQTFDQSLTNLSGGNATITDNTATPGTTTVTANIVSGTNTFGGTIRDGNAGRVLKFVKDGPGSLILTKANGHSYSGGTFLNDGRLDVRTNNAQVLPSSTELTINGTSTFAATNNGGAATTATLALNRVNFAAGDGIVESNQLNASTDQVLTFAQAPTRSAGATGNFTLTVASDPSRYKVVFTNAPATGQSINGGLYYNFGNFLAYDSAGYARPLDYTTDSNASLVALSENANSLDAGLANRDVLFVGAGSNVTAQQSLSLRSLKIAGPGDITLAAGESFTLSGGGFIKAGGGTATIGGGSSLTTGSTQDLIFNVDQAVDTLTIQTPVVAGGLVKTGLGRLNLDGDSNLNAPVWVNGGETFINGSLSGVTSLTVNRYATLGGSGTLSTIGDGDVTVAPGAKLAPGSSAGTLTLELGNGVLDLSAATASAFSGTLKFELGSTSDKIALTSGFLDIGTSLSLSDFAFSDAGGFGEGEYVLFTAPTDIIGNLDFGYGTVLGFTANLGFTGGANGRSNIVLTVVPEPSTALALLGGLGVVLGLRRPLRRG